MCTKQTHTHKIMARSEWCASAHRIHRNTEVQTFACTRKSFTYIYIYLAKSKCSTEILLFIYICCFCFLLLLAVPLPVVLLLLLFNWYIHCALARNFLEIILVPFWKRLQVVIQQPQVSLYTNTPKLNRNAFNWQDLLLFLFQLLLYWR